MRLAHVQLLVLCLLVVVPPEDLPAQITTPVLAPEIDLKDIQTRAAKNDPQAQTTLGTFHQLGQQGLKTDFKEAMKWFQKAAQQGDPGAMYRIGYLYYAGQGVQQNVQESARWFIKSAASGFSVAQYTVGTMYSDGYGVTQSDTEALRWFSYAAEQGYAPAQHQLGSFIFLGRGTPPDWIEGCKWFYVASAAGYAQADEALALNLRFLTREQMESASKLAQDFKPKPPRAVSEKPEPPALFTELLTKANAGDPDAQNELSLLLQSGKPTLEDLKEARKWLMKAADGGNAEAQHQLGSMYFTGQGMVKNYIAAYKWMSLALEKGRTNALAGLNRLTTFMTPFQMAEARKQVADFKAAQRANAANTPATVATAEPAPAASTSANAKPAPATPVAESKAPAPLTPQNTTAPPKPAEVKIPADLDQLRKEAESGKPESQLAIGLKFLHGQGVTANRTEALKWLEKSANLGHGPAQYWFATTFDAAHQNDRVKWMRRSADSGFGVAQFMVGQMYFTGQGVTQDSIEAYKWLHLASQQGNPAADTFIATVAPAMNAEQIEEAKRRAEEVAFRLKNK